MPDREAQDPGIEGIEATRGEEIGTGVAIALGAVPGVGGLLSGLAGELIARRQNRRFEGFLRSLVEDLKEVQGRLNEEFIRTEGLEDLAEDVFTKAADTRQREKLDAFRAIFVNTVSSANPSYDQAAEVLDLIDRWQGRHVVLLRILDDPISADEAIGNPVGEGGGISTSINSILRALLPQWSDDEIERTWKDLYDAQLHRTSGTKTMMTDRGIYQLENRLTDFGRRVADFIRNH